MQTTKKICQSQKNSSTLKGRSSRGFGAASLVRISSTAFTTLESKPLTRKVLKPLGLSYDGNEVNIDSGRGTLQVSKLSLLCST
mmetsp:Transcript_66033/g.129928  ORF Transcript_66033/g.129928 Transcript_66033/m.129928 type:complete len:84 (+) Transcript_66033:1089-1340(+)